MHVGKSTIQSGDYRILIDGNHLTIQKGKNIGGGVRRPLGRARRKSTLRRNRSTADGKMLELRFGGGKSVFVLEQ